MSKKPDKPDKLRAAAEAELSHVTVPAQQARPAEELLHELQVYQIELEMQNEELRLAQLALEISRDRYVDLYEFAPVGYLILTRDGLISEINLTGAKLLGVERKKLLHRSLGSFVLPEQRDRWNRLFVDILQGSEATSCELVLEIGAGERLYAKLNCQRHENDGNPPVVRITLSDITERKQAEAEKETMRIEAVEARTLLQTVLDSTPDWVFVKDGSHRFLFVNSAFAAAQGYEPQDMIGRPDTDFWPDDLCNGDPARGIRGFHADDDAAMAGNLTHNPYDPATLANGELRIFDTLKMPLRDTNGHCYAVLAYARDVTGRKNSEQRMRELTAHLLTVREEEKASIAREIHDDLGGTLTAIKMEVHWLAEELSASKEAEPLLKHVELRSHLTDNAVNVTRRVITGLRPTVLDDLGLLAALEWQAGQFHNHTGIACRVNSVQDKAKLDRQYSIALFRIFQEALTNVARHSGATRVEVEFHSSDEEVMLSVSDNGRGLPDGHTVSPTSYGVRGMCERVEQLGGKIKFDSPPGGGFNVTVTLPLPAEIKTESKT
ncbi:MAG: PAS domain-containing protein [Nitrosomonadales bacterium]|nr:PAS domain-containing protein [Nitrosomonadales bacterium]